MAFLKNLRIKAGIYFLRQQAIKTQRDKRVVGFKNVKSIVLLFQTTGPNIPENIYQLTHALGQDIEKVYQVVYNSGNSKKLQYGPHEKRVIIGSKELNLFYVPHKQVINCFNDIHADYLLDLSIDDCFPLIYLAGISSAQLKMGKHSELRLPYYDVLISDNSNNQQELIQHTLHYIKMLNPQPHE